MLTWPRWAVVEADRGREEMALLILAAAGFVGYLPLRRKQLSGVVVLDDGTRRRTRGPGSFVFRPLLDGFLFALLHEGQRIPADRLERWTHWRFYGKRAFVSEHAIDTLRQVEREGRFDDRRPDGIRLGVEVGAEVMVGNDPSTALRAVVANLDDPSRVVLQSLLFGGATITAKAADIHPVAP